MFVVAADLVNPFDDCSLLVRRTLIGPRDDGEAVAKRIGPAGEERAQLGLDGLGLGLEHEAQRVDLVRADGGEPLLLELELTEPSLFLAHAPNAAQRFAQAIADPVDAVSSPRSLQMLLSRITGSI